MASPSPRRKVEVRFCRRCWLRCCWLLLALSSAGCCYRPWCLAIPPRHVPRTPPCFGRDTSPWAAQHKNFLPRPRHSKEWPADSLGAGGA